MQIGDQQIYHLNADKRRDHATESIDQQILAQ
jgi:hypothetical protein